MNKDSIIKITNLTFAYNAERVLEDINLEIQRGDFVGIIGPNGGGKTTLLRIILGLIPKPKKGNVFLFGQNQEEFINRYKIGYVPQRAETLSINFPVTVEEIVSMGRTSEIKLLPNLDKEDKEAIYEALKVVEMVDYRKKLLSQLSGGLKQRVFIARALASKPELLILDEPTVGVDLETQKKFYDLLKKLNENLKLTLVLVSHDIDVVVNEVKTLVCLNHRLVCHGLPKEIIKDDFLKILYGKDVRFILHGH